jgi:CysZ protein
MSNNPISGASHAFNGLTLVLRPGLRRFIIVPVLVNILVFSLLIWGGMLLFEDFMAWLLPADSWLLQNDWLSWLTQPLAWLLWLLFAVASVLVVFYTFTAIANLIASPFNSLLAEKVEAHLSGRPIEQDTGWSELLKDIPRTLASELRKLSYFVLRALPLLLLFAIPVVNLAAPFLWIAFTAWYTALEYADFPMGNHRILFKEQHQRLRRIRLNALGFGGGITLLMAIPLVNFLAMPAGVAGATLLWHRELSGQE